MRFIAVVFLLCKKHIMSVEDSSGQRWYGCLEVAVNYKFSLAVLYDVFREENQWVKVLLASLRLEWEKRFVEVKSMGRSRFGFWEGDFRWLWQVKRPVAHGPEVNSSCFILWTNASPYIQFPFQVVFPQRKTIFLSWEDLKWKCVRPPLTCDICVFK